MSRHQSQGKYKKDAPNWKWGKTAKFTKSADARAHVAKAAKREAEKLARKLAVKATAPILSDTEWNAFEPFRGVKWIPAVANRAIGTGGVSVYPNHGADLDPVVFDGKTEYVTTPITDSARLIAAASRLPERAVA